MKHSSNVFFRILLGLSSVLMILTVALLFFTYRIGKIEDRRNELLLGSHILSEWDSRQLPSTGVFDSVVVAGCRKFDIRRIVSDIRPGEREMRLLIGREGRMELELVKRYYE